LASGQFLEQLSVQEVEHFLALVVEHLDTRVVSSLETILDGAKVQ